MIFPSCLWLLVKHNLWKEKEQKDKRSEQGREDGSVGVVLGGMEGNLPYMRKKGWKIKKGYKKRNFLRSMSPLKNVQE